MPNVEFDCETCGQRVVKYHQLGRKPRRFCSKECVQNTPPPPNYTTKYNWTPEMDKEIRLAYQKYVTSKNALDYLEEQTFFLGRPRYTIKYRACRIGAAKSVDGSQWTQRELEILLGSVGERGIKSIQRKLKSEGYYRAESAIRQQIWTRGKSTKNGNVMSAHKLSVLLGCNDHTVLRWIQKGWIKATQTGGENCAHQITRREVKRFVTQNPGEIDKLNPDLLWLISLLTTQF